MESFITMMMKAVTSSYQELYWLYIIVIIAVVVVFILAIICIKMHYAYKRKLAYYSVVDDMTGFINYKSFLNDANILLQKNKSNNYALVYISINEFAKLIVEYQATKAEQIIVELSNIIYLHLNEYETFCRMSDDVFLILKEFRDVNELVLLYNKIENELEHFQIHQSSTNSLTLNCGFYQITSRNERLDEIISKAEEANSLSRKCENKAFVFYNTSLERKAYRDSELEAMMHRGIDKKEFLIYLQPKYDITTNMVVGGEALVRWNNGKIGMIQPDIFIPLFERNGFIRKLDFYIFEEVCQQIRKWLDASYKVKPISINMSYLHFSDPEFINRLKKIIWMYRILFNYLELEFKESSFFDNKDQVTQVINKLKLSGFKVTLDDFGENYSSLRMVSALPFDNIKLDKNYISTSVNLREMTVLKNFIQLSEELGFQIICEGIETKEQADYIKECGLKYAQGYLFSKPMSIANYESVM